MRNTNRLQRKKRIHSIVCKLSLASIMVFVFAPLISILLWSIWGSRYVAPGKGFDLTYSWYLSAAAGTSWWSAMMQTLLIGIGVASIAVMTAFVFSSVVWAQGRNKLFYLGSILVLPIGIPWLVYAFGISQVFGFLVGTVFGVLIAQTAIGFFASSIVLMFSYRSVDSALMANALSLGVGWWRSTFLVLLPTKIAPLLMSWLLVLFLSLDDVFVVQIIGRGRIDTFTLRLWRAIRFDLDPESAAAAILFLVILGFLWFALVRTGKRLLTK